MRFRRQNRGRSREQGYVLMLLLLTVTLMMIATAIIVPSIAFDIKREREEEMIHRGVQYSRAIRAYYKKFGRYPVKLEDLENTNQMRFLRKRYKDPLTGKDFRLLHFGEAKLMTNGAAGGMIPGANTIGPNGALTSATGLTSTSPFGSPATFGASGSLGNSSSSPFGQTTQTQSPQASGTGDTTQAGADGAQPGTQPGDTTTPPGAIVATSGPPTLSSSQLAGTQVGGAPIVGVASLSKDPTIREFDHKKKYSEWQFVYDPTMDRGFLITTPYQPSLMMNGMNGIQNVNGQPGQPGTGTNPSGFGNGFGNSSNGFGNSFGNSPSGMQNNPTSPNSGFGNSSPNQPQQNSPQQQ